MGETDDRVIWSEVHLLEPAVLNKRVNNGMALLSNHSQQPLFTGDWERRIVHDYHIGDIFMDVPRESSLGDARQQQK